MAKLTAKQQREKFQRLAALAAAGDLPDLDKALRASGYIKADEGIPQADLVNGVERLTRATLAHWRDDGLPYHRIAGRNYYPPLPLIAYIYDHFVRPGRPGLVGGEDYDAAKTEDMRYRAKTRKLTYEQLTEVVIDRADAERVMIGIILEVRAALLALPSNITPQVENRPAREIRPILDRYVRWMCSELASGRVPVPAAALADLEAVLARHIPPPTDPEELLEDTDDE